MSKYLNEEEMSELNRVVTMYIDFAEDQARRRIPMYMKDWEEKLNSFLNMTGREVLHGAGHVSADQAKKHAFQQYEIYDEHRLQMQEEQVVDELMQSAKDIKMGKGDVVPKHLVAPLFKGYVYPHSYPNHYVEQQYLPDDLKNAKYYEYGNNKAEQAAKAYWDAIKGKKK